MYDVLLQQLPSADKTKILKKLTLKPKTYVVLTTHRPENVDNPKNLTSTTEAMIQLKPLPIIFPAHSRTQKQIRKLNLYTNLQKQKHVEIINSIGHYETLNLIQNAKLLLKDSGGMQKEAFWLKTPCLTLRNNTEWIETIHLEANCLTGPNTQNIIKNANKILENEEQINNNLRNLPNPFGDGKASDKIVKTISNFGHNVH